MVQLVVAFILSRIDYCNAVLAALPQSTIQPLQRAQNAAARLGFGLWSHDHISPALAQWLPVQLRIKFKLCLPMHQIHVRRCPAYLGELVSGELVSGKLSSTWSAFNKQQRLVETQTAYKIAERAFSFSGLAEWICLPSDLRMITDTTI